MAHARAQGNGSNLEFVRAELEELQADYDAGRYFGQMMDGVFVPEPGVHANLLEGTAERLEELEAEEQQLAGARHIATGSRCG